MDDLVAVRVTLESGVHRYFVTWGRIQDAVDPTELERIVLDRCSGFSLGGTAVAAELCDSLQAAKGERYFFEALFEFGQRRIPFGEGYEAWRQDMDRAMRAGKQLYFLGRDS